MSTTNGTGSAFTAESASAATSTPDAPDAPHEGHSTSRTRRRWTTFASPPLARRTDGVADTAQLRARVELARILGESTEERVSARALAEKLAARGTELDAAVELARRSLAFGDDPALRHALAGWLEGLGEPALAASELRRLVDTASPKSAAALLVRIGVLHARAFDPAGAQDALAEAANLDESDALSLELLGAIAGWSQEDAEPSSALERAGARSSSEAYVRAARRRAAAGDAEAELEDLLRAFELDASSSLAAAALSLAFTSRGRGVAADEVLRAHAAALVAGGAAVDAAGVHEQRRTQAAARGDLARALAAALDEGLDGQLVGVGADAFDDLLVRAGAFEALAARLELRADALSGRGAAQRWADIGRLLSGPLAAPERALEAYARSVAADATDGDANHALRVLSQQVGSRTWLLEALIRGVMGGEAYGSSRETEARLAAARALAALAEELNDEALEGFAHGEIARLDPSDDRAAERASRFVDVLARQTERITSVKRRLAGAGAGGRAEILAELVRLLASAPRFSHDLAATLAGLARAHVEDDDVLFDALRAAERVSDFETMAALCQDRLAAGPSASSARVRVALVSALRRAGDGRRAAEAAATFDVSDAAWAFSVAWISSAVAGERAVRARALAAVAPTCGPVFVSALFTVAAEELAATGDRAAARKAAELACRGEADDARALRALSSLVSQAEGRVATTALEHAVAASFPTSAMCARLAQTYEQLEDGAQALAWTRRLVALRPGDADVVQILLDRAARGGDADGIADVLAWLIPQPQPAKVTADRIGKTLEALGSRDPQRAVAACHRALDVLGPRHPGLRSAIVAVATPARDFALRTKLAERWIAAGAPPAERGALLVGLARDYAAAGDTERELVAYARAARASADLRPARDRISELASLEKSPDGELAWLEARAELAQNDGQGEVAITSMRKLGAAFWDMADDRPRAVQAWLRAARLGGARGYETLRLDLTSFADAQYAVDCLAELVDRERDRARSGIIANEAARAAIDIGAFPHALALARTALEKYPGHAEALEAAEKACGGIGRVQEMSPLYDQVARGSRGRFGRRAAHHRAARYFEAAGIPMLALKHAAQAFIAVPSEGTTLGLLARTSERAQRRAVAVRTVEHVADLARSQAVRAAWLLRATYLAGRDLEGTRQRFELLLKATVLAPAPTTLAMLGVAARELLSLAPDDTETIALRLEKASDSLAKGLEGPDGARIAIAFAQMALDLFGDATWAWRSFERALDADGDIDEYAQLVSQAGEFARAVGAKDAVARAMAACEKPYANVGLALLRLVAAVANAVGDSARRARALVIAAEKESDDDDAVADADEAVASLGDAALTARLSKKVGVFRRTEALRAVAARLASRGESGDAVQRLERALEIAPSEVKDAVAAELSEALLRAGRGEEAVLRDLNAPGISAAERAERWVSLARIREERGDVSGATDALMQAATDDPTSERWAAVERSAEASAREHIRVEALENLVKHVAPEARLTVQKRLARAEGARGSLAAAEAVWRDVWAADPSDAEADVALEALLVARNGYDELAEHLARRAERLANVPDSVETRRAVRLRRAAILEQRLSRLEDAAQELELLLTESPGNASALRWIADLRERLGQPAKAVPVLAELASRATDPVDRLSFEVRRVRALLSAGDFEAARSAVREISDDGSSTALLEVRVDIARSSGDPVELGSALTELARLSREDGRARSEMLVEAAQAAARAGDNDASRDRAREAARLAPDVPSTQLFARGLEYRLRGAGTREDAEVTMAALLRVGNDLSLEPEDVALCAFLLAEAEDVVAPGKGELTLRACLENVGPHPLVALGLAERAARAGRDDEAFRFYVDAAHGNLLGLRRAGAVALAAADAADRVGDGVAMTRFLQEAARDPEVRLVALRKLGDVATATRDVSSMRTSLRTLAESLEGEERVEVLAQLARTLFESANPAERIEADRTLREAMAAAPAPLAVQLRDELDIYRSRQPQPVGMVATAASAAPPAMSAMPVIPAPPPVISVAAAPEVAAPEDNISSVRHPPLGAPGVPWGDDDEPAGEVSTSDIVLVEPVRDPQAERVAEAHALVARGEREQAEKMLSDALRGGSLLAADALDEILAKEPSRAAALLKVRRQAVELDPGDMRRLAALRDAARADQNPNYASAIEHVMRAFDPLAEPLVPPPLGAQHVQPGMLTLLTRHSREPAGEAFGVLWEGASGVFAKPPTAYGMTGLERVVPGPMSPLSRLYEVTLRLLDTPRFSLFHRRSADGLPATLTIALLANPSAILSGDAREDSKAVRWLMGEALSAVIPQNALPLGLPPAEGEALFEVLGAAFGPPGGAIAKGSAHLAETLWQTLAPRAQRRLQELMASPDETSFELVVERAKQSGRRVGMFLTGDFAHAAHTVVTEQGSNVDELTNPGGLARLCKELPALADLFRLAVRPEYADARWHTPAPSPRFATGRLSLI